MALSDKFKNMKERIVNVDYKGKVQELKEKIESVEYREKLKNNFTSGIDKIGNVFDSISKLKGSTESEKKENLPEKTSDEQNAPVQKNNIDGQTNKEKRPLTKEEVELAQTFVFAQTAAMVASQYSEYKKQAQTIKKELEGIAIRNKHNLAVMKQAYKEKKPAIDQILKGLDAQQKQLDFYKEKTLTEEEHKTYQFLLVAITKQIDSVVHLYDTIMG